MRATSFIATSCFLGRHKKPKATMAVNSKPLSPKIMLLEGFGNPVPTRPTYTQQDSFSSNCTHYKPRTNVITMPMLKNFDNLGQGSFSTNFFSFLSP